MIYFISGFDKYLVDKKIKEITENLQTDEFDVFKFDGSFYKFKLDEVILECNTYPLFSKHKQVFVVNPLFFNSLSEEAEKEFIDFIKADNAYFTLIFYGETDLNKKKKFSKELHKYIKFIDIKPLDQKEFNNHVRNSLKKYQIKIDEETVLTLIDKLPNDLENLQKEIVKLSLYNDVVTKDVVNKLICKKDEDDIFALINAISEKRLKKSLNLLREFKAKNIDALGLILILATSIRFMYQVKYLKNKALNNKEIAEILKSSEGRIHYTGLKIAKYTVDDLLYILAKLADLDQAIKSGKTDPNTGFELFIMEMTR